ncbi:hypothetical protein [Streptomyces tricolor]|uniref:hypothetical protein n=1 Tax=Streptomyces tricolor TaxID=68277 RepID=UPI0036E3E421
MHKWTKRRTAAIAGALAAAGLAITGLSATPAAAEGGKIQGWRIDSSPFRCDWGAVCFYYSPGAEGAIWRKYADTDYNLGDNKFWSDNYGSAGSGTQVHDNSASMDNGTGGTLWAWKNINMTGSVAWTPSGYGGNLGNVGLRNEISSYNVTY